MSERLWFLKRIVRSKPGGDQRAEDMPMVVMMVFVLVSNGTRLENRA